MSDLPIDTSNPAVRDYLALARFVVCFDIILLCLQTASRLQVLTPLSVLINIGSVGVCSYVLDPSLGASRIISTIFRSYNELFYIGKVSKMYPTSITPSPKMITTYVIAIFVTQIGYCAILVFARRSETKVLLISLVCSVLLTSMKCTAASAYKRKRFGGCVRKLDNGILGDCMGACIRSSYHDSIYSIVTLLPGISSIHHLINSAWHPCRIAVVSKHRPCSVPSGKLQEASRCFADPFSNTGIPNPSAHNYASGLYLVRGLSPLCA